MTAPAIPGLTPSQTVGPYLSIALAWPDGPDVVAAGAPGEIWLHGVMTDGRGDPVPDGLIETWQADPAGRYATVPAPAGRDGATGSAGRAEAAESRERSRGRERDGGRERGWAFRGFGRCPTDAGGRWAVRTVRPGRVPLPDGRRQAPHINVTVFGRGLLRHLVTRIYLPDEPDANAADPVLAGVPAHRRSTLVATADRRGYRFDIRLQGPDETVFFAL